MTRHVPYTLPLRRSGKHARRRRSPATLKGASMTARPAYEVNSVRPPNSIRSTGLKRRRISAFLNFTCTVVGLKELTGLKQEISLYFRPPASSLGPRLVTRSPTSSKHLREPSVVPSGPDQNHHKMRNKMSTLNTGMASPDLEAAEEAKPKRSRRSSMKPREVAALHERVRDDDQRRTPGQPSARRSRQERGFASGAASGTRDHSTVSDQ